jgi:rhodanese-related sulfurtransferase
MVKRYSFYSFLFLFLVSLPACSLFSGEKEELVVINVLDKNLYDDCHIEGSINIPFEIFEQYAQRKLSKSAVIVVYCSNYMCSASGEAALMLKKMGFKKVWAYEAGMAEWYQQKLPVVGPCSSKYLNARFSPPDHQELGLPVITTQQLREKMLSSDVCLIKSIPSVNDIESEIN